VTKHSKIDQCPSVWISGCENEHTSAFSACSAVNAFALNTETKKILSTLSQDPTRMRLSLPFLHPAARVRMLCLLQFPQKSILKSHYAFFR
jgi:hypothetical protein